ncbi:MAG: hypothetical protein ACYCQI_07975 [Gammaproteobacteria bacterium]
MSSARLFKQAESKEHLLKKYFTRQNLMNLLRIYNFGTALLVLQDYIKNAGTEHAKDPSEYFGDICIHLVQAALSFESSITHKLGALFLNGYRLYDIPSRIALGIATVPNTIALVDSGNHFINTAATTAAICTKDTTEEKSSSSTLKR